MKEQNYAKVSSAVLRKLWYSLPIKNLKIILVVSLFVVFSVAFIAQHSVREYTSDDVAQQVALQSQAEIGGELWLPDNNWSLHFPIYKLGDAIFQNNSRTKLLFEGYALGIILFVCMVYTLLYFLKATKNQDRKSLMIGFLSLGALMLIPSFTNYVQLLNHRHMEIGFLLIFLTFAHRFLTIKKIDSKVLVKYVLVALLFGLLWFEDGYEAYLFIGGLSLTVLLLWLRKKISLQRIILSAVFIIAAFGFKIILQHFIVNALDLHLVRNQPDFYFLRDIFQQLSYMITDVMNVFGIDIFNNNSLLSLSNSGRAMVILGLVMFGLYVGSIVYGIKKSLGDGNIFRLLLISTNITNWILMFVTASGGGSAIEYGITSRRYWIFVLYTCAFLVAEIIIDLHKEKRNGRASWLLTAVLMTSFLFSFVVDLNRARVFVGNNRIPQNVLNNELINAMSGEGDFKKGYGQFWTAVSTTYFSNHKLDILQVDCGKNSFSAQKYLVNKKSFSVKSSNSFLVIKKDDALMKECSIDQFRVPIYTVETEHFKIYFYNYDIGMNLGRYWNYEQ